MPALAIQIIHSNEAAAAEVEAEVEAAKHKSFLHLA